MAEVLIVDFDMDGLTAPSLRFTKAAVRYASYIRGGRLHTIPIKLFCEYAALPNLNVEELYVLLEEARKAVATVEVIDSVVPDRHDLGYMSWPLFKELRIEGSQLLFEIRARTFDDWVLSKLWALSLK